jgi:ribosomal protein S18 acetylase RimI-like enzyme
VEISKATFKDVAPYASLAAKSRVSISDTKNTEWFTVNDFTAILGFAGLMKVATGYRIKGVFVHEKYRGLGIGNNLTQHLFDICNERCANIEVYAYNDKFYIQNGFETFGELPNGAKKLRKNW